MNRVPTETNAAFRAQWLAELTAALDAAQKLTWELSQLGARYADVLELYGRLEAVRVEAGALRTYRPSGVRADFAQEWTDLSPWSRDHENGLIA